MAAYPSGIMLLRELEIEVVDELAQVYSTLTQTIKSFPFSENLLQTFQGRLSTH